MKMHIESKLPEVGTTIFTVMSALANKHGAINLSQGFPDFPSPPVLIDLVSQAMRDGHNQYPPMPGMPALLNALAGKIRLLYGLEIAPQNEITITPGATEALYCAITATVNIGDEVIVFDPAYDSYQPVVELNGGICRRIPLTFPSYGIDWDTVRDQVSDRTRLIIINTPHNPTGSLLSDDDLDQLAEITRDTNILVIADEVYEHIVFDGLRHASVLNHPELYQRSFAVYSFGKTYHVTGWKIGYCVAPPTLTAEFRKVHQFNGFTTNTPMQVALAEYLKTPSHYLELGGFLQQKRDYFLDKMKHSRLKPLSSKGTYFQCFDYSAVSDMADTEYAKHLTAEHGVASIPLSVFYGDKRDNKVLRFCFAKNEATLDAAAEILCTI
jgi:methionine aminotransferase